MTWQRNFIKVKIGLLLHFLCFHSIKHTDTISDIKVPRTEILKIVAFEGGSKASINWTFNANPLPELGKEWTPFS